MTPAQRRLVKIERISRLLKNGDIASIHEIVDVPYSVAFHASAMVRSPIIDETKLDEFSRATANSLINIEKEIRTAPTEANKYFAD